MTRVRDNSERRHSWRGSRPAVRPQSSPHGAHGTRRNTMTVRLLAAACCLLLLAGGTRPADGVRVLAFGGVAAKSHWNFMKGALLALADAGHPVTVYTPFPDRGTAAAVAGGGPYTEVDMSAEYGRDERHGVGLNGTVVVPLFSSPLYLMPMMADASRFICELADRLLADRRAGEFDVFVTEPLGDECAWHAARRLGVPLVYTVPAPALPWIEALAFGRAANPAYVPHVLHARSAVAATFRRRLSNAAAYLYTTLVYRRASAALGAPRYFGTPVEPAVVFVNTHHVTESSRPVPANRVDVGGVHLRTPKPLPADILEFIEGSPDGVIYLSLGTVVTLSSFPDDVQKAFKDAIAEVPQRVLMKYETQMEDKPKNVMTSKWLPQRDVLLHPKVKLFVGHGGISGLYEAVDAGVPVLGFPMFYDQPKNIDNLVNAGMAISLDLFSVTKDTLLKSINELVNNETYAQNAKTASEMFKDRPISPAQSVVYWTDYVVRHKDTPNLKSFAHNLSWYQYFLIDLIALMLFTIILVYYSTCKVLKLIKVGISKFLSSKLKLKSE